MKMIRVIKAYKLDYSRNKKLFDKLIHCQNLDEVCNMVGKTVDDVKTISYRRQYDFPNDVIYCKNEDIIDGNLFKPLTNRIIQNVNRVIKNYSDFKLSLPVKERYKLPYTSDIRFYDSCIDIMTGGGYYCIFFSNLIKNKNGDYVYEK